MSEEPETWEPLIDEAILAATALLRTAPKPDSIEDAVELANAWLELAHIHLLRSDWVE